jgi:hypothetical protein
VDPKLSDCDIRSVAEASLMLPDRPEKVEAVKLLLIERIESARGTIGSEISMKVSCFTVRCVLQPVHVTVLSK